MPVVRIDDQVLSELKKRAVELGLVFKPPNDTLRRMLGLDPDLPPPVISFVPKKPRFGTARKATPVKDTATGQVYPSKYKAGLEFRREFPTVAGRYLWYPLVRRYPGRFVEIDDRDRIGHQE